MKKCCARRARAMPLLVLGAALSLEVSPSASAQEQSVSAGAAVTLLEPVGAGVAFDVSTQALTAIFLTGRRGEQLSLTMGGRSAAGEAVLNEAQTYRAEGGIVVLSTGIVSIDVDKIEMPPGRTGRASDRGTTVVLAQFN